VPCSIKNPCPFSYFPLHSSMHCHIDSKSVPYAQRSLISRTETTSPPNNQHTSPYVFCTPATAQWSHIRSRSRSPSCKRAVDIPSMNIPPIRCGLYDTLFMKVFPLRCVQDDCNLKSLVVSCQRITSFSELENVVIRGHNSVQIIYEVSRTCHLEVIHQQYFAFL
jgi:hypothetical protein